MRNIKEVVFVIMRILERLLALLLFLSLRENHIQVNERLVVVDGVYLCAENLKCRWGDKTYCACVLNGVPGLFSGPLRRVGEGEPNRRTHI